MVKMRMSLRMLLVSGLMVTAAPAAVLAQDNDYAAARNMARIHSLEGEVQRLTGLLEEANYAISQLKQRMDRMATDTDFRLSQLEKGGGAAAPVAEAAPPPRPAAPATAAGTTGLAPGPRDLGTVPAGQPVAAAKPPAPPAANTGAKVSLPAGSARQQYEFAFDLLTKNDYPRAESAFKQFVAQHPDDALAGNAQYWLGETYYVRNNFGEAASQFLVGYQKYPKNTKAPDNLLKLGLSLANLGRNQDACAAFGRFDKEYPQAAANLKRRVGEERQRLGCR